MRIDPRYTRVQAMITDANIPRDEHGVLRLCRACQREVAFRGGFLKYLVRHLDRAARYRGVHS